MRPYAFRGQMTKDPLCFCEMILRLRFVLRILGTKGGCFVHDLILYKHLYNFNAKPENSAHAVAKFFSKTLECFSSTFASLAETVSQTLIGS